MFKGFHDSFQNLQGFPWKTTQPSNGGTPTTLRAESPLIFLQ